MAILVVASPVSAANIQFSADIALDPMFLAGNSHYLQDVLGTPIFTLQAGDTLTGTIMFSNGSLSVVNQVGHGAFESMDFLGTGPSSSTHYTGTVQVVGLSGNTGFSNPAPIDAFGGSIVAVALSTFAAQNFTSTGFSYALNILSVQVNGQETAAPFHFARLDFSADTVIVNVPEPFSVSLVFGGLCGLVLLGRRRRNLANRRLT